MIVYGIEMICCGDASFVVVSGLEMDRSTCKPYV